MNNTIKDLTIFNTNEPIELANLSFEERTKLYCEIEAKSFYLRGKILQSIKEDKCYKEVGYKTFEEATKDVLGLSKAFSYRLICATDMYEYFGANLAPNLPTAESQVRPLIQLEPEQQIEIWQEAAKDKVPTAKEVQMIVDEKFPKKKKKSVTPPDTFEADTSVEKPKIIIQKELYVTIDKYTTLQKENDSLRKQLSFFADEFARLTMEEANGKQVPDFINNGNQVADFTEIVGETKASREEVVEFIARHGNDIQRMMIKASNPNNERLYRAFEVVRKNYLLTNPPQSMSKDLLNATYIE